MDGWTNGQTDRNMDGRNGIMTGWIDQSGQMEGWMDGTGVMASGIVRRIDGYEQNNGGLGECMDG